MSCEMNDGHAVFAVVQEFIAFGSGLTDATVTFEHDAIFTAFAASFTHCSI